MPSPNKWLAAPYRGKGFTLLELLVVIALIGLLMGLSAPAFSAIGRSMNTSKSATDVAEVLQLARSHAKAANGKVEVGFASDADGLRMAVIFAREGSNYTAISRVYRFPQVRLAAAPQSDRPTADVFLAQNSANSLPSFQVASQTFDRVIQFNNRGEASALSSGLSRCIEIGLLPNVNGVTPAGLQNNFGAIQVAGLSGGVTIFRP